MSIAVPGSRNYRQDDYQKDGWQQIFIDIGDGFTQGEAEYRQGDAPKQSSQRVKQQKCPIPHFSRAGGDRHESPAGRDESG